MVELKKGSIALVTGGTSGIGLALVAALHKKGVAVRFCARTRVAVDMLEQRFADSKGYVCDITDPAALAKMIEAISSADGRLDLLVANVGMLHALDFTVAPLGESDIRGEIELNLVAPILTVNRCLPLLRQSDAATIVMIGSGFGWSPGGRAPIYSAAKAGIRSFVMTLRAQLKGSGVHVMEVVPPTVDTPAVADRPGKKLSPDIVARETIAGIFKTKNSVFPGESAAIPWMLRLAPGLLARMTLAR